MENEKYQKLYDLYKAALDSVTDLGMTLYDAEGRILLYNLPSARADGLNQKDVLGKTPDEVFVHQTKSTALEVLRTGQPVVDQEIIYTSKMGKLNYCIGSTYPLYKNEILIGAFSIIRFNNSVKNLISQAIQMQKALIVSKSGRSNGTIYTFDSIIGNSKSIMESVMRSKKAALSPSNIMLYGETGTGKELFAQSIHNAGACSRHPFVAVNCAAIPDTLLESMLFGTSKGAFTGAQNQAGLFEEAGEGTLFLDEINSMPTRLQTKLLRVLQQKTVRRLGLNREIPVRCRVVSACNRPPLECIDIKELRDDLYYRLAAVCIDIEPLRERKSDIILLAEHFISEFAPIYGMSKIGMSKGFREILLAHAWPGNVRELRHAIESSFVMLEPGEELDVQHLPMNLRRVYEKRKKEEQDAKREKLQKVSDTSCLKNELERIEREEILKALEKNDWNVTRTAEDIGYTRSNLQYRMKKLKIYA